jgi:hypothetical protein
LILNGADRVEFPCQTRHDAEEERKCIEEMYVQGIMYPKGSHCYCSYFCYVVSLLFAAFDWVPGVLGSDGQYHLHGKAGARHTGRIA